MRVIETERLVLRPWRESDAESLYEYAKDERVGPIAGWQPHKSLEDSLRAIREVLSQDGCLAVTIKGDGRAVGSIAIFQHSDTNPQKGTEIGYWLGVPFWGRGYIPEAVKAIMKYCFEERGETILWCGHYEGNEKSCRVIKKCGFTYAYTDICEVSQMNETRREYLYSITREDWEKL
ncbi:MAG: GNAT family N-acetyltransferase [Clostridiales bacterium]|nr:GNAT family N-acetyltransferase [Clostridiales bacterium]